MCIQWLDPNDQKVGHFSVVCPVQLRVWLGQVTHLPTDVILIPAAVADAKSMSASGCLGSSLPNNIVLGKVVTDPTLRNSKASMFFVGLAEQIKPQDPEMCLQIGGPEPQPPSPPQCEQPPFWPRSNLRERQ